MYFNFSQVSKYVCVKHRLYPSGRQALIVMIYTKQ